VSTSSWSAESAESATLSVTGTNGITDLGALGVSGAASFNTITASGLTSLKSTNLNVTNIDSSSPYSVLATDFTIVGDATANDVVVNLPAATKTGRVLNIRHGGGANNITIDAFESEKIDNTNRIYLNTSGQSVMLQDYATGNWCSIASPIVNNNIPDPITFGSTVGITGATSVGVVNATGAIKTTSTLGVSGLASFNTINASGNVWMSGAVYHKKYVEDGTNSEYSVSASDYTIIVKKSDDINFTVNLPAATGTGRVLIIKNIMTDYTVIVDGASSEKIDGANTKTLATNASIQIQDCGTGTWYILASTGSVT